MMTVKKIDRTYLAIGMMSGTSVDGIDVALIETNGRDHVKPLSSAFYAYQEDEQASIRSCFGLERDEDGRVAAASQLVTTRHIAAVQDFLVSHGLTADDVDVIGFHGQTVFHAPDRGFTWQIGDGQAVADATAIHVVCNMRAADVKAGGQGAPLVPLYHRALASTLEKPVAILNLGGVGNVTYIGPQDTDLLAFDTGPGNALIDRWVRQEAGLPYDGGGKLASEGNVDQASIDRWLKHPYFAAKPPKSLDVLDLWQDELQAIQDKKWNIADGAATLAAYTVQTAALAARYFPQAPDCWYVCGGGRHNQAIMQGLAAQLSCPVQTVEDFDLCGDSIEAEAFAYLAVRSRLQLPLTMPGTTGVDAPLTGGDFCLANNRAGKIQTSAVS